MRYADVVDRLRLAYNSSAEDRDQGEKVGWKLAERAAFLERLKAESKKRLLEVGAGTGQDSVFFKEAGLTVVATDLSPEMVARCKAKGLEAHCADFLNLGLPSGSFDAVYGLNCLLHVPTADLGDVLAAIRDVLAPDGMFFLGVYGGDSFGGESADDWHVPASILFVPNRRANAAPRDVSLRGSRLPRGGSGRCALPVIHAETLG